MHHLIFLAFASVLWTGDYVDAFYCRRLSHLCRGPVVRLSAGDVYPENEDMDFNSDDDDMFREIQDIKKEMYGTDIPLDEELQQSTLNAENAFLAAMLEQTSQFKRIKSQLGSDRAVEIFMDRIKEEDNPGEEVQNEDGDTNVGSDEENPGIINNEGNSWQ